MKKKKEIVRQGIVLGAMVAATIMSHQGIAEAALAVDFSQTAPYENGGALGDGAAPYTVVGWSFSPTTDLYLTRMGLWDGDVEKRHSESHYVGIWDSSRNLLSSVTILEPAGASHDMVVGQYGAQFHMENLSAPLILSKDATYYVASTTFAQAKGSYLDFDTVASFTTVDAPLYQLAINGNIRFLHNAYGTSSVNQLVFPGQIDTVSDYLVGANIDVTPTPVPAAAWLLGSGLLGLVGIRRKKS